MAMPHVSKFVEGSGVPRSVMERALLSELSRLSIDKGSFPYVDDGSQAKAWGAACESYAVRAASERLNRISRQKQNKHVPGTKEFERYEKQRKDKGKSRQSVLSVSIEEAQRLVDKHAGTGDPGIRNGDSEWKKREYCQDESYIGVVHDDDGNSRDTRRFAIMYADKNVHVVPVKEIGDAAGD